MKTIDITPLRERGVKLATAIENAVRDTQTPILTPLPDVLLMTKEQFDDMAELSNPKEFEEITEFGMRDMFRSKDRMWITKYNVMEIRVKDDERTN